MHLPATLYVSPEPMTPEQYVSVKEGICADGWQRCRSCGFDLRGDGLLSVVDDREAVCDDCLRGLRAVWRFWLADLDVSTWERKTITKEYRA